MSLKHNTIFARIFCAALTSFGISLCTTALYAQVPTTNPLAFANGSRNTFETIGKTENTIPSRRHIVKVMNPQIPIPFGVQGSGNSALLDMKSNEQEFVRNFTFKNTSSASYTINSIDFEKHDNLFEFITIEPGKTLPMEVAPGQTFSVLVAFHAIGRNDLRVNRLSFVTEQSNKSITYPIQAMQLPFSSMPWNQKVEIAESK